MKNHLTQVQFLSPGETFEIGNPLLRDNLRNGVFLFSTTTSSRIIIDSFNHNIWANKSREYIANSTLVEVTGRVELEKALDGTWQVAGTLGENGEIIKAKRGRKPKIQIIINESAIFSPREQEIKDKFNSGKTKVVKAARTAKPTGTKYVKTGKPRGRARVERTLNYPKGRFNIKILATLNKLTPAITYIELHKDIKSGKKQFKISDQKREPGARGKSIKVYQVIK